MTMYPSPKYHSFRSKKYLDFIRSKNCLVCGNINTVAHHEGLGRNAQGAKPPDSHAVPLCNRCHQRRHDKGVQSFWGGWDVKMEIIWLLGEYIRCQENTY